MTRPVALAVRVEGIPEALRRERRWVCWRYDWDGKRWTKVPYQPRGIRAKSDDPSTWCSFDEALAAYRTGRFDGVGFVLGDGWAALDVDHFVGHTWPLLEQLAGYHDTSPSTEGFKIFGRSDRIGGQIDFAHEPPTRTRWEGARFCAVTGHGSGDPLADLTPFLDEWFPAPPVVQSSREGYALAAEMSDDDLLIAAVANDSNGDDFLMLWRGETAGYASHSEADLALCCHLAFWTNYSAERVDRMFRLSGLMRPKWDRAAYRRATLRKAISGGQAAPAMPGPDVKVTAADLDADWTGEF